MKSDEALHEAALSGDLRAFDALYERYEGRLFAFIRGHLRDAREAEDVLQETFLAVLKGEAPRSLKAWLFQVARNLCLNRARSASRQARALETVARSPDEAMPAAEHVLNEQQLLRALRSAVEVLPLELSELYHLRASGMAYDEMAQVLAVPVGTVKSRMHALLQSLREELKS